MNLAESSQPPAFLIVGGDGLIGDALVRKIRGETYPVYATSRRPVTGPGVFQLDLAGKTENLLLDRRIPELAQHGSLTSILVAALTGIADCARDPQGSRLVNVTNTVGVARELMALGSAVIFISSNAVFSGKVPYPVDFAETDPITDYGRQKAEVEKSLLAIHTDMQDAPSLMIVRLTKVVARTLPLVSNWIGNLRAGKKIDAFDDRYFSPISLPHTIESIIRIGKSGRSGIYHVTGSRDLTYYDFAQLLAISLGVDAGLVNPVAGDVNVIGLVQKHSALGRTRADLALSLAPEEPEMVAKWLVNL